MKAQKLTVKTTKANTSKPAQVATVAEATKANDTRFYTHDKVVALEVMLSAQNGLKADGGIQWMNHGKGKGKFFRAQLEFCKSAKFQTSKSKPGFLMVEGSDDVGVWAAQCDGVTYRRNGDEHGSLSLVKATFKGCTGFYKSVAECVKASHGLARFVDATTAKEWTKK